jgi:transposase
MTTNSTTGFVGCDLGDKTTTLCLLDDAGQVVRRSQVETARAPLVSFFRALPRTQVVMEVGSHSPWVSAAVEAAGHRAIVINPHQFKLLTQSRRKSDANDAELLARAARADLQLVRPIRHRSESTRSQLAVLRTRDLLVRTRARLVTHVRGMLKSYGVKCPRSDTPNFATRAKDLVPAEVQQALEPIFEELEGLTARVKKLDAQLEDATAGDQTVARLRTVPRVGLLTALTFKLVIESASRFKKSRDVGAYLGLTPAQHQSGESDPRLGITKSGDALMRRLLVQCGQQLLFKNAPDCALSRAGKLLMKQGKPRNVAAVAVARKLAALMHLLWVREQDFKPFP